MEPISIVGLVGTAVSLIQTSVGIVQNLHDLKEKYKSTNSTLQNITQECSTLGAAVAQIKIWIEGSLAQAPEGQRQRVLPLNSALHEFTISIKPLNEEITNMLGKARPSGILPHRVRFKVVWNETKMKDHLETLRWQANAIQLLLAATRLSPHDSHQKMEGIARAASQFREGSLYNDAGSTMDGREFQFDDLVINSAAYRRVFASQVRRSNASSSLLSTGGSSAAPHHPGPATPEGLQGHPGSQLSPVILSARNRESNIPQESNQSHATEFNNYPDAIPPPPGFEPKNDLHEAGMNPLHIACWDGTINAVEMLLRENFDPSAKTTDLGWTPLHYAIRRKRYQVIKLLLEHGAKNRRDMNGITPLHFAAEVCSGGHFSTILDYFGVKSMRDILDGAGRDPIHYAAFAGNLKVIKILDQRGALIDQEDNSCFLPLHYACLKGHLECVRILSAHFANTLSPKTRLYAWRKVVCLAMSHHRWEIAEFLLNQWASKPDVRKWGQALLCEGILAGSTRLLDLVPLKSTDLNTHHFEQHQWAGVHLDGPCSYTIPLFLACGNTIPQVEHQVATVKWLLAHGASSKCQDSFSNMPMHEAARRNNVAIAQALLESHSPLEHKNNDGETPLHMAVRYGAIDMVRFLLEEGVTIETESKIGLTPASMPINALDIEWRPITEDAEQKIRRLIEEYHWLERQAVAVTMRS